MSELQSARTQTQQTVTKRLARQTQSAGIQQPKLCPRTGQGGELVSIIRRKRVLAEAVYPVIEACAGYGLLQLHGIKIIRTMTMILVQKLPIARNDPDCVIPQHQNYGPIHFNSVFHNSKARSPRHCEVGRAVVKGSLAVTYFRT